MRSSTPLRLPRSPSSLSVATRLALATVLVVAVASGVAAWVIVHQQRNRLIEAKRIAAGMVVDLLVGALAPALDFDDEDGAKQAIEGLRSNPDVVHAAAWSAEAAPPIAELTTGSAPTTPPRPSADATRVSEDAIDVERVVRAPEGGTVGQVSVRFSLAPENQRIEAVRLRIGAGGVAFSAIVAAILIALARRTVVAPLARLTAATRALERGERVRVGVSSGDELGRLAAAFDVMTDAIVEREVLLDAARGRLQELFDHLHEAIVVFGPGGALGEERSRRASEIFGAACAEGASVVDLLYPPSSAAPVEREAFSEWVAIVFDAEADWADVVTLAPAEVTLGRGGDEERTLALSWVPVQSGGALERVMLLAKDVTQERRLELAVATRDREHARQIAVMRRLLAGGGQLFVRFLEGSRRRLDSAAALLDAADGDLDAAGVEAMFQRVHTLKGEARAFELTSLEKDLAAVEVLLGELRIPARRQELLADPETLAVLRSVLARARALLDAAEETFVAESPIGRAVLEQVTVRRGDVDRLVTLTRGAAPAIRELVDSLASRPFGETASALLEEVPRWAERVGKAARVELEGREVGLPPSLAGALGPALGHLARNAIAHGVEAPEERARAGKPPVGVVRISCSLPGPVVVVEDDGAGLDEEALSTRGRSAGTHDAPALEAAFTPGVSTAAKVDELAGWGVGLGAARAELAQVGFEVVAGHGSGGGARFEIRPSAKGRSA